VDLNDILYSVFSLYFFFCSLQKHNESKKKTESKNKKIIYWNEQYVTKIHDKNKNLFFRTSSEALYMFTRASLYRVLTRLLTRYVLWSSPKNKNLLMRFNMFLFYIRVYIFFFCFGCLLFRHANNIARLVLRTYLFFLLILMSSTSRRQVYIYIVDRRLFMFKRTTLLTRDSMTDKCKHMK
jgi:hypothetical protein